ncbi:MAG: carboxypeptidase-like regulatory domain-containing protein [Limnohabitans sp.]
MKEMSVSRKVQFSLSALAIATLVACGGGSSSTSTAQLSGVAAYGAPLSGASVTLTDSNGKTSNATAAADGSYTLDVTGLTAPFLLKARGTSGDAIKEYTALVVSAPKAGETATANVTPLTHALVTMVSSDGTSPNEFTTDVSKLKNLDASKLNTALTNLQAVLKDVLTDAKLPSNFDPLTISFKADRTTPADTLLDTIKVSISDQGVALTNARVPVADTTTSTSVATVTLKGTSASPAALPKPSVDVSDLKGLDAFIKDANACLELAPENRVSKDSAGAYTFKGACANVSGFDTVNYKAYGYSLNQLWGARLLEQIPANSTMLTPEFLLFLDEGNKALVRLASSSPNGGRVYFETAAKTASGWQIIGNQRNYDASVGVRFYRQSDLSTNGWTIPGTYTNSADAGKNVGKLDAYTSRLTLSFNQSGPNGSNVYAVRVKGPGLPASGIVLARSSACGTGDYLGFYSNNGTLPAASTALPTTSSTNSWVLDVANFGTAYKGTDFYNQYRGLTSTGLPSTSAGNNIATAAVDMKSIPEFALYNWEVFTTSNGSNPATFTSRIITRPLAASEGSKLPWASLKQDALEYLDPNNATKNVELTSAMFGWSLPNVSTPAVTSAYLFGSNTAGRMNMGQSVAKLSDTSISLSAGSEYDGNGKVCSYAKVPTFTATAGYREVGLRQTTDRGLTLQQFSYHNGRN